MVNILMAATDWTQIENVRALIRESEQMYNFFGVSTVKECLGLAMEQKMDLLILDTDLNDPFGVEIAEQIRQIPGYEFAWIILLGTNPFHEIDGFRKAHCYDYLTKPYQLEALYNMVRMLSKYETVPKFVAENQYISVRQRDQIYRILTSDILYIEVVGNNSTIYTYSRIYCLRKMSLKKLQLMLPDYFVQCHKSFIVNRNYIEAIQKGPYGWEINLKNYERTVPSGDKYKGNVINTA